MDDVARAHPAKLLMVEDSEADARLTIEALKDSKLQIDMKVVIDGVEALKYLRRQAPYKDADRPDLILLDLNLPKKNGLEVLGDIKNDESLKGIPVVIMTSSQAEEDIVRSYKLHANCFITKPLDLTQFSEVVRAVDNFWFSIVTLPGR